MSRLRSSIEPSFRVPSPEPARPIPPPDRVRRLLSVIVLLGAAAVPVFIARGGYDEVRLPKELALYAVAIAAAAIAGAGAVLRKFRVEAGERARLRAPIIVAAAGLGWTIVATLTSTNRMLSGGALIWVASLAVVFFVSAHALRHVSLRVVAAAVLLPALVNTLVVSLQALRIWNPWTFPPNTPPRLFHNALLGNPDDVGAYLSAPALFCLAAALATKGRWRVLYAAAGCALLIGVLLSETLTAIFALTAAAIALTLINNRRTGIIVAVVIAVLASTVLLAYRPLNDRVFLLFRAARAGHWGTVTIGRLVPIVAAANMFADHPVTGVGPGCFKFNYLPYHIAVKRDRPELTTRTPTRGINFAETHNDHAQILAEAGFPAYGATVAALLLLASVSWRRDAIAAHERARLTRLLAFPFSVLVAVMMLAQFPWHLAAPAYTYVFIAGACFAWSERDPA